MSKPNAVGRMAQWAIKLSQFKIEYMPRLAIKAQLLADFIVNSLFQVIIKCSYGQFIPIARLSKSWEV